MRRLLTQMKALFCCRQLTSGQFGQKEVNGFQKTRVLSQAFRVEGKGGKLAVKQVLSTKAIRERFIDINDDSASCSDYWHRRRISAPAPLTRHVMRFEDVQIDEGGVTVQGSQQQVHPLECGPDTERTHPIPKSGLGKEASAFKC